MPPIVLDVVQTEDRRDLVHQAVEALAAGHVIAIPTETVYGLACRADRPQAVDKLLQIKQRPKACPLALTVQNEQQALDYVPELSPLALRIARRSWPGPITLVAIQSNLSDSLISQFSESVQQLVAPNGSIGMRVPANGFVQDLLSLTSGPLVLTSANRSGKTDSKTAAEVLEQVDDGVRLIFDDGPCHYGQPSTVVRVNEQAYEVLREGVVSKSTLARLATWMVVLVCTGNTCRSPMAELLLRAKLSKKLGCTIDQLDEGRAFVMSAGISAGMGGRPSPEAVEVMREYGLDLSSHQSQPLNETIVRQADLLLTMTAGHRDSIISRWPDAASRVRVLRHDGGDVDDPIGGTPEVYRSCARQMERELDQFAEDLNLT